MKYKILLYIAILFINILVPVARAQDLIEELMHSVQVGDQATVREYLAKGMDVETSDPNGTTLLMMAAREGHFTLSKMLLDRNARVRARNAYGDSAILLASLKGHLEIVKLLHAYGAELDTPGWTPLHYCSWEGRVAVCQYLLEEGARVDAASANGTTPLMMAARQGQSDTVKLLLAKGAKADLRNQAGATALTWALKTGHMETAELLRKAGATE